MQCNVAMLFWLWVLDFVFSSFGTDFFGAFSVVIWLLLFAT
jgi:hypothetical protein